MAKTTVVRCPQCGSTNAGGDESQSFYEYTYMMCGACGHGGYADHWQLKFDWNVDIDLAPGEPLPKYLPPLAEDEDDEKNKGETGT